MLDEQDYGMVQWNVLFQWSLCTSVVKIVQWH